MKKHYSINVLGKVQGVAFRYHTKQTAQKLSICGFVKNMVDGSVYIEAEGNQLNIQQFINWCKQGPSRARVDTIHVNEAPVQNYKSFEIR